MEGKQHLEHVIPQNKIVTAYLHDKLSAELMLQMPLCLIDDTDKHILEGDWQTAGNWEYPFRRYKLAGYTKIIKDKSDEKTNIENIKKRNEELGVLSNSLDEMTNQLNKRIATAENYSTDLLHEIRNPLASLKSASDIISETENKELLSLIHI